MRRSRVPLPRTRLVYVDLAETFEYCSVLVRAVVVLARRDRHTNYVNQPVWIDVPVFEFCNTTSTREHFRP